MLSQWNCFSLIINLVAELAKLARTLFTDGMRFMGLLARSPQGQNTHAASRW